MTLLDSFFTHGSIDRSFSRVIQVVHSLSLIIRMVDDMSLLVLYHGALVVVMVVFILVHQRIDLGSKVASAQLCLDQ